MRLGPTLGARVSFALIALLAAIAAGFALTACGDDDEPSSGATTVAQSSDQIYAEGLASASEAAVDLAAAVVSGDSPEEVASQIESALAEWEAAIGQIGPLDLTGELASQRDTLVASSDPFVAAWTNVADEWSSDTANGLLELAQQIDPIVAGIQGLEGAVGGALQAVGSQAQETLDGVESELQTALDEIQGAQ